MSEILCVRGCVNKIDLTLMELTNSKWGGGQHLPCTCPAPVITYPSETLVQVIILTSLLSAVESLRAVWLFYFSTRQTADEVGESQVNQMKHTFRKR